MRVNFLTEHSQRLLLILAGLILLLMIVIVVRQYRQDAGIQNALEANFRREFGNLVEQLEQASLWLDKAGVSDARHKILYLTRFSASLEAGQAALSQLPVQSINLSESRKFLAQAADYGTVLSEKLARGETLTEEEQLRLDDFSHSLKQYNDALAAIDEEQRKPNFSWVDVYLGRARRGNLRAKPETPTLRSLANLEEDMSKLPVLVYDGPFSDQPVPRNARALTGSLITAEDAVRIAEHFARAAGVTPQRGARAVPVAGDFAVYSVRMENRAEANGRQRGTIDVDVSQKGGQVVWYLNDRTVGDKRIQVEKALEKAQEILAKENLTTMRPVYYVEQQNILTILFVAVEKDVLIYPDQIKVQIALDNGQLLGWEAVSYWVHHHRRTLPEPTITAEQVQQAMRTTGLPIDKLQLAIIPSSGGTRELLCWEVHTRRFDEDYLVYVNAQTGEQERILKLMHVDGGTLAR